MTWTHNGAPFLPDDVPPGAVGFVYEIVNLDSGVRYIGKKLFSRTVTRPPLKGSTRKRRTVQPSDWQTYWSSSNELQRQVASQGSDRFSRTILAIAYSRGMLSYLEAKLQFERDVLLDPQYLNGIIACRINRTHVNSRTDLKR